MKSYITFLTLGFFGSLLHLMQASAQKFAFNRVSLFEENVMPFITGIAQDAKGYMWFTGASLYRYDGYHIITYKNNPRNPQSIAPSRLESICIDHKGIIWIGTFGSGLDRFDRATGIFTHFLNKPGDSASLSNNIVTTIIEDKEGTLWVGTHGGLNRLDQKTGKFTRFQKNENDVTTLSNNQVRALYEDRQGTIWVGCGSPFGNETPPGEGGLNRLDKKTGKFIRYMHDPHNPHSLIDNKVRAIYEDSRRTFWVGTFGDGLHTMDREKGTFTRYLYDSSHPEKLSSPRLIKGNERGVAFIQEDITGGLWIGSFLGGLNYFDPRIKTMTHFEANKDNIESLSENTLWYACSSNDGVVWISTQNNIYRIDPLRKHIPHINVGSRVNAFLEDASGVLWIGSDDGLIRSDSSKKILQHFIFDSLNPVSISNSFVSSLYQDRENRLWVGTRDGLNLFNPQTKKFTRYQFNDKDINTISEGSVLAIIEDHLGGLWIATLGGLDLMNRHTGSFKHYRHNPKDASSLSNNSVKCILEDRSGNLWIGTSGNGGIDLLHRNTGKFKHYLRGYSIANLFQDSFGVIWVATEVGLYYQNSGSNEFSHFIDPASEIGTASIIAIVEDNNKNLWVSSQTGIFKINSGRNETTIYGKKYGINANAIYDLAGNRTHNGELLFGNSTGYYAFFPDQLISNPKPPQVILTDFRIADVPVKPGKGSALTMPIEQVKQIKLNYKQNVFSFDFAGIHYSSPEENRHFYMLEGYEKNWRKAGSEKTAYYFNVPPGEYVFRVKASSSNGIWAEKAVKVIVMPPWWRTWGAYTLFALLFAGSIWAIIYYRSRSLIKEKQVLEQKVNIRTTEVIKQKEEIQNTLQELKSTQAQLIQQAKMASLGELTAGIAHEIQNPLNFVNNFSEVNKELVDELQQELKAGKVDDAIATSNDIKENELKIIHHGKRADAIVKGMLQHSRVSTGQKESTDLNKLADEYLRLSYHGMRAKDKSFNLTLQTDFDNSIGKMDVVPQDMGRVLLNLFNNSFYSVMQKKKETGDAYEPTVSVCTKKVDGKIEIDVRDNGIGIPQKVVDKIFQPFFTTKPTGQGTGLGLSLSYDIIKAHAGEIKVETREGDGAKFIILLPT